MKLRKLENLFYLENTHLKEALDNQNGVWMQGKSRGYGIVIIPINNLSFAIPLRSVIKHKSSFITVKSRERGIQGKGLDFTKSLLITDLNYISNLPFKIPSNEHDKLVSKEHFIKGRFEKYVSRYIIASHKLDYNILGSSDYRFTTLCNYHYELGIK